MHYGRFANDHSFEPLLFSELGEPPETVCSSSSTDVTQVTQTKLTLKRLTVNLTENEPKYWRI